MGHTNTFEDFATYRTRHLNDQQRQWFTYHLDALKTENDRRINEWPKSFIECNIMLAGLQAQARIDANLETLCEMHFNEPIDYAVRNLDDTWTCMLSDSQREVIVNVNDLAVYLKGLEETF